MYRHVYRHLAIQAIIDSADEIWPPVPPLLSQSYNAQDLSLQLAVNEIWPRLTIADC